MSEQSQSRNGYTNGQARGNGKSPENRRAAEAPGETGGGMSGRVYPLSDEPDALYAASGRSLAGITLEAATGGELASQDLQVGADTLLAQAEIARRAGFRELAANLTRAAELTAVPNQELLRMYEVLRPGRSTYEELLEMAHTLESRYGARVTAEFVREAAQVYQTRDLLRRGHGKKSA